MAPTNLDVDVGGARAERWQIAPCWQLMITPLVITPRWQLLLSAVLHRLLVAPEHDEPHGLRQLERGELRGDAAVEGEPRCAATASRLVLLGALLGAAARLREVPVPVVVVDGARGRRHRDRALRCAIDGDSLEA